MELFFFFFTNNNRYYKNILKMKYDDNFESTHLFQNKFLTKVTRMYFYFTKHEKLNRQIYLTSLVSIFRIGILFVSFGTIFETFWPFNNYFWDLQEIF